MRNFKFFALALLCVLGVVFSGCNNDAGIVDDSFGLSFTLPDGKTERSVFYDISEVASYEINVSQNGYTVTTKTASPGDTVKIKLTDLGDYDILVTAKNAGGTTIAKGTARVTFVTGDTGYKNVVIDIEPEEKTVGVKVTAAWETPGAEKYGADDAVRYDVTVYEGEKLVGQFENVSVLNTTYTVYIPYYSTYTVKVEAIKANLTVVGSGSGSVTLSKGDVYKNLSLSLTIVGEDNIASGEVGIDAQINWVEGYRRETVEFGSWPQSLADVTGITLTETG
ncbi:MAG: hypothetical protein HUK25_04645, partial [Treponema sp.]|nr:hypothetical protein [Treponema sp.]